MSTRVAERRRSRRVPAVHPATIMDEDGCVISKGRTSDTSECGVFLIVDNNWEPVVDSEVVLELRIPGTPTPRKPDKLRTVAYHARVVRTSNIGSMIGVGLELLTKVKARRR